MNLAAEKATSVVGQSSDKYGWILGSVSERFESLGPMFRKRIVGRIRSLERRLLAAVSLGGAWCGGVCTVELFDTDNETAAMPEQLSKFAQSFDAEI